MINYDELPSRGKVTSGGEFIRKCHCGGRCYANYDENKKYSIYCEKGGHIISFRTNSMDMAIRIFNDMPHPLISENECKKPYGLFSSGTEYEIFLDNYCQKCGRYHEDKDGMPTKNSCRIEKAMARARFETELFPDHAVYIPIGYTHKICTEYISPEEYKKLRKKPVRKASKGQVTLGVE